MPSSVMLRSVARVRIGVSGEHIAFIIRMIRLGKLETTLVVTKNRRIASYG
jgi:hypothetical protein